MNTANTNRSPRTRRLIAAGLLALGLSVNAAMAQAETINVAVAANFTKTVEQIGKAWEKATGNQVKFSFGPTGKLYAQIRNGAPFDAFFAADSRRPNLLIKDGDADPKSFFVYANGQVALYSKKLPVAKQPAAILKQGDFAHLAIANPKAAPYGAAAVQVMQKLGVYDKLQGEKKIVQGESISHTFQFVATDNAQIGFVALSQLKDPDSPLKGVGQYWLPPQADYAPIEQAAVFIKRSHKKKTVDSFFDFVRSKAGAKIIRQYGYGIPKH